MIIDIVAVEAAIEAVVRQALAGQPHLPQVLVRVGESLPAGPGDAHLRLSVIWERPRKTGAVLHEAAGMAQILVVVPHGAGPAPSQSHAGTLGDGFEPFVDGAPLAGFIRITAVAVLTTRTLDERPAGGRLWCATPLQVDFRLEMLAGVV